MTEEQRNEIARINRKLATTARKTLFFPVTREMLPLSEIIPLIMTINSEPVRGFPAGTLMVKHFSSRLHFSGLLWQILVDLEYSPLGFPEIENAKSADLNVLFADPAPVV